MAIDDWLLDELVLGRGQAVLRLYSWARPTLSLGFHQRRIEPAWSRALAAGRIAMVRRPSGGRAVLHGGCLTYAVLWPEAPRQRREAYAFASAWLGHALADLGHPLTFGQAGPCLDRASCFASSTSADLVEANGAKRIGSAQLWRRGQLLQHGSLLIEPPARLWQELFDAPPPCLAPLPLGQGALELQLRQAAETHLGGGPLQTEPLSEWEWAAIDARRQRFRVSGAARAGLSYTSPPSAMPRAT